MAAPFESIDCVIIDIIFVSSANDVELFKITKQAIYTCNKSLTHLNKDVPFYLPDYTVVESGDLAIKIFNEKYNIKVIPNYDTIFNYNKALNKGIEKSKSDYIAFCNNDLIFEKGWLENLINAMEQTGSESGSPFTPENKAMLQYKENTIGWTVREHFNGACFVLKRSAIDKIGGKFNECVEGWFSDNVVAQQLINAGVQNVLCPSSIVHHLGSKTIETLSKEDQENFMNKQIEKLDIYIPSIHDNNPHAKYWLEKNQKK